MGTIVGNFLRTIKRLFLLLTAEVKKQMPEIIQTVNNIKNFVDSPDCDVLTAIIPGTLDDTLKVLLRKYLSDLLKALNTSNNIANLPTLNDQHKAIIQEIQLSPDSARDILYHGIAAKLTEAITGKTWSESILLAQGAFVHPELLK